MLHLLFKTKYQHLGENMQHVPYLTIQKSSSSNDHQNFHAHLRVDTLSVTIYIYFLEIFYHNFSFAYYWFNNCKWRCIKHYINIIKLLDIYKILKSNKKFQYKKVTLQTHHNCSNFVTSLIWQFFLSTFAIHNMILFNLNCLVKWCKKVWNYCTFYISLTPR